jgi:hypothetical protein
MAAKGLCVLESGISGIHNIIAIHGCPTNRCFASFGPLHMPHAAVLLVAAIAASIRSENGGAKLDHGSGGEVLLRAA